MYDENQSCCIERKHTYVQLRVSTPLILLLAVPLALVLFRPIYTTFLEVRTAEGGRPEACFRDYYDSRVQTFCLDQRGLKRRIHNLGRVGIDTSAETWGLRQLEQAIRLPRH